MRSSRPIRNFMVYLNPNARRSRNSEVLPANADSSELALAAIRRP
jgi:hypothetical protein